MFSATFYICIFRRVSAVFSLFWLLVPVMPVMTALAAPHEVIMNTKNPMPPLNEREADVILRKATEAPYTGRYFNHHAAGSYLCRQ